MSTSVLSEHVDAFLLACHAKQLKCRTREWYKWILNAFLDYVEEGDWAWDAPSTIDRLFAHLAEEEQSKDTIHGYYRVLRRFFNWLRMRRRIEESPIDMVESPGKSTPHPRGISKSEVEKLLSAIEPSTYLDHRDRAIVIFLWDTGVRASELCDLKIGDLEMCQGDALVEVGKRDKSRTLAFGQRARKLLSEWLDVRSEAKCDRVFVNRCRKPLTRSGLYAMLKRRKEEVGIEDPCNPHAFRHGFAIDFLENGGNINNLRILMGHETLRSTEPYLKATDRRARRDHGKASPGDHLNI